MDKETLIAMGIEEKSKNVCKKCGAKLGKEDYVYLGYCENCYNKVYNGEDTSNNYVENDAEDTLNDYERSYIGIYIICFLVPLIGFIGYVTHYDSNYILAKKCLVSGLISIFAYFILLIIIFSSM